MSHAAPMPTTFCRNARTVTSIRKVTRIFPPLVTSLRLAVSPIVVKNPSMRTVCSVLSKVTRMMP